MKKQLFLMSVLSVSLLMPVSQAQAGWPTFDVAKLASLITNLVGRYQPVPQVLSRVNQVKTTMEQIKAQGQAAMSKDLKSVGQTAASAFKKNAFSHNFKNPKLNALVKSANGSDGTSDASAKIKDAFFGAKGKEQTQEERAETLAIRKEFKDAALNESRATALYMAVSGAQQSQERFEKADKAMQEANTIQDAVNANTLMLMNGNYERMNKISLQLASLKQLSANTVNSVSSSGYTKPEPAKDLKLGDGTYTEEEKDEIDVNFE